MPAIRFPRHLPQLAAAAALSLLAACASAPAPAPVVSAEPIVAAPPSLAIADRVLETASAYEDYMNRSGAIAPGSFSDGSSIQSALRTGVTYEAQQFAKGAVAYGAVVALQDQGFLAGVRQYTRDPAARAALAQQIWANPAVATGLSGAEGAASAVVAALGGQGYTLRSTGERVKQSAYDVQRSAWSKASVVDREGRLAQAKQLSSSAVPARSGSVQRLQAAVTGAQPLGGGGGFGSATYTPTVARALAVAALAILGEAGDSNADQLFALMGDPQQDSCLRFSKMMLYQCLAVSKPHYEDIFCLGQHALIDTGQCVMSSVGMSAPAAAQTALVGEPVGAAASVGMTSARR